MKHVLSMHIMSNQVFASNFNSHHRLFLIQILTVQLVSNAVLFFCSFAKHFIFANYSLVAFGYNRHDLS